MRSNRQSSLPPDVAKLYNDPNWRRRRLGQLLKEPRCVICLQAKVLTAATVADHIVRCTDEYSFWHGALQSLCEFHHQSKRQAESGNRTWKPKLGCGPDGMPRGDHPWNR